MNKTLTFKVEQYQILETDHFDRFYNPIKVKIIKVHFLEPYKFNPKSKTEPEYSGIYLPLNLVEQTTSTPSNYLTDDNVAFILKNQAYETNITKDSAENIYLGNIIGVRADLTNLNHLNDLAKKAEKGKTNLEENKQLNEF